MKFTRHSPDGVPSAQVCEWGDVDWFISYGRGTYELTGGYVATFEYMILQTEQFWLICCIATTVYTWLMQGSCEEPNVRGIKPLT